MRVCGAVDGDAVIGGADEFVATSLAPAHGALATVDPYSLHRAIARGELSRMGDLATRQGTWRYWRHGLHVEYRSPVGVEVDLGFTAGAGWADFDPGTVQKFATFNDGAWGRVGRDGIAVACDRLVAEGALHRLGPPPQDAYAIKVSAGSGHLM